MIVAANNQDKRVWLSYITTTIRDILTTSLNKDIHHECVWGYHKLPQKYFFAVWMYKLI